MQFKVKTFSRAKFVRTSTLGVTDLEGNDNLMYASSRAIRLLAHLRLGKFKEGWWRTR